MTKKTSKIVTPKSQDMGKHLIKSGKDGNWIGFNKDWFTLGGTVFGTDKQMFCLATSAACLDVLATDVSKTKLHMREKTDQGSLIVQPEDHPVAALIDGDINPYYDFQEFLRIATYQLALKSEFFIAANRTRGNEVTEFCGIPKVNTSDIQVNATERKWYTDVTPSSLHDEALFGWISGRQSLDDVIHIRRRTVDGQQIFATSSIASEAIGLVNQMMEVQKGTFKNGGIPQLAFTFPDGLTDEQFHRLRAGLAESLKESQKNGKPLILEGKEGVVPEVKQLSEKMTDTDFVKSNSNAGMDILRYFRMPPHKVYIFGDIKYDNLAEAERVYVDDSLCSYFSDIQRGLNKALLTKEERKKYFFEFDVESAYTSNPKDRQEIVKSRFAGGMITRNQMLKSIGENTLPPEDGDVYIFSGNFVMTDMKNNVILRAGGNTGEEEASETEGDADEGKKPKKHLQAV